MPHRSSDQPRLLRSIVATLLFWTGPVPATVGILFGGAFVVGVRPPAMAHW